MFNQPSSTPNTNTKPAFTFNFTKSPSVQLSEKAFQDWRKFIYDLTGIYFQDNKKYLLESRLQKRINYLGLDSFEKYLEYCKFNPKKEEEKKYLFEVITINETFFFRNQPQLDALSETVVPELLSSPFKVNKNKIRIWSAASSSGEEAYSTAITLLDLIKPKYPNLQIEIVGTDINFAVIETAKKAEYKEYAIRNTPPIVLRKYFKAQGNTHILDPRVKEFVNFKILNLFDDMAMKSMVGFDIIFCANVLIYFDQLSKTKVVSHLYNSLNKGGYLFIG